MMIECLPPGAPAEIAAAARAALEFIGRIAFDLPGA